ncbi:MAG TPA: trypsin-like peptidase domain-containing protein [Gaiellales bacterium]|jgi:S1-C subfamily serine protease
MIAYVRQGVLVATAAAVGGASALALGGTHFAGRSVTTIRRVIPLQPENVSSTPTALDAAQIYKRDAPGVVVVNATLVSRVKNPLDPLAPGQKEAERALGSGFVIDRSGHILTNAHVVAGARSVTVGFRRGGTYRARVLGLDRIDDVAVLDVAKAPRSLLDPLPLGSVRSVQVGDPVVAIGNPLGEYRSITEGIVSAKRRQINSLKPGYKIYDAIQTDAAINHGNSGGPLIDRFGDVIGITNQILTGTNNPTSGNIGIGFAVPIDAARTAARQIIATGRALHTYLGIAGAQLTPSLASAINLPVKRGVLIGLVRPGSPAARAGLRGGSSSATVDGQTLTVGGDIIVSIDGRAVVHFSDLAEAISALRPGSHITLGIIRAGTDMQVPVTLGAQSG